MAILKMNKIRVAVHHDAVTEVVKTLQDTGVVELTEVINKKVLKRSEKTDFRLNYVSGRLDFAVSFLSKYEKKNILKSVLEEDTVTSTNKKIKRLSNRFHYNDIIDSAYDIVEKINFAEGKLVDLEKEKDILHPWRNLDLTLSDRRETDRTKTFFLTGKPEIINKVCKDLKQKKSFVPTQISETTMTLTFTKNAEKDAFLAIKKSELSNTELPFRRGTPAEELERMERAEKKTHKKLNALRLEAKKLTVFLPDLRVMSDYIHWRKDRFDLARTFVGY